MKPSISFREDFMLSGFIYELYIPKEYLIKTKRPRLRVTYWLLKLLWKYLREDE